MHRGGNYQRKCPVNIILGVLGRFYLLRKLYFIMAVITKIANVVYGNMYFPPCEDTGCLKIIVFRVRGLVGDILLTK
jgi:hypothetical protein